MQLRKRLRRFTTLLRQCSIERNTRRDVDRQTVTTENAASESRV